MDSDGLEDFDYTQPLHYALSQLKGEQYRGNEQEQFTTVHFPKPSSLSAMADDDDSDKPPPTTNEIIDELVDNIENYPKVVQILMQRGLLKKRQQCRKCDRAMHLRRRKTCYEWRCRTKDKKGDCSSCSVKYGSWFEYTKLPFKIIFNYLIMHCKDCSTTHMVNQLKLSTHTVNEVKKVMYELTDRIEEKYPRIGQNQQHVLMEIITLQPKKTSIRVYKVLAGQEIGTKRCFAVVMPDEMSSTFERIKKEKVAPGAEISMVKIVNEDSTSYASLSATLIVESQYNPEEKDRFFTNLRKNHPDHVFTSIDTLQNWLNDQVVRRTEGTRFLERCVEELKTYVKH